MDVELNRNVSPPGLTRREAETRLRQYGPNAMREAKPHLFLAIAKKFWAPVPWVSLGLGSLILLFSFETFLAARYWLQLPLTQLQTLVFITLVFTGQGNVYLVRERRHFWKSMPGKWLVLSSAADIMAVSILAWRGILMKAIPLQILFGVLIACGCYLAAVDFLKTGLLRKLPQGL
jgi:magnesium-transporting ATPase (P-type)